MTLPMEPDNTFGRLVVWTFQVKTVEVAVMTRLVPPGTDEHHSTIVRMLIIVTIFCSELEVVMIAQRVASTSWTKDTKMSTILRIY